MPAQNNASNEVRILIVDDHPLMREALKRIIQREANFVVCGEAEDSGQALAMIATARPNLAIVDLTLKNSNGLDLVKKLHDQHPKVLALVLSMHDETVQAERAIRTGARGYITKQEVGEKILSAIRQVLNGEIYWSEKVAAKIASRVAGQGSAPNGFSVELLTDREMRVFELIGLGRSPRQISAKLNISVSTVGTYRARIKEKLNLNSGFELVQYAIYCSNLPK
jgi:DNA-binding NarL/FixJ family response regulator